MTINIDNIEVRGPVFANEEGTIINMQVLFEEIGEFLPFSANPNDPAEHGREIYARAINGRYGEISPYVKDPIRERFNSTVPFSEFRNRFTKEELIAIRAETMKNPELYVLWEDFQLAGEVVLADEKVKEGMNLFYTSKVLTKKRINEVLKV